jgi:hypothetical protein
LEQRHPVGYLYQGTVLGWVDYTFARGALQPPSNEWQLWSECSSAGR